MANSGTRTKYYLDVPAIRELVRGERQVRGISMVEISEQTGINIASINRFLSGFQTVSGDALITLVKWANGDVLRFIKRRGNIYRHIDTPEQRKLRQGQEFLSKTLGVSTASGESPVDTMIRLLALAQSRGLLDDQATLSE